MMEEGKGEVLTEDFAISKYVKFPTWGSWEWLGTVESLNYYSGAYKVSLKCSNCNRENEFWVKRGIPVSKVKRKIKEKTFCFNCGIKLNNGNL